MAEEKKTKPVATVKTESLKADTAVKAAESAKKTVKAAVKKASAKKAEVKAEVKEAVKEVKTEVKEAAKEVKAAAKKAAPAKKEVKAAPAKKAENVSYNISLQYQDKDWNVNGLVQSAKDVWVYDMGRKLDEIKTVDLYVKPEESRVYFVVNGTENGEFAL